MRKIYTYGLAVIENNKILLCESYAFKDLILPGGIKEDDELHVDNLLREISEELGDEAVLDVASLKYLGNFEDLAAGEGDTLVEIELYAGAVSGRLKPSYEIKRLHWYSAKDDRDQLSAVIKNKILPYLIENKYLVN
jgi:ADP-ribose pyrophosphatase YjhB (NUDIX family)